MTVLDSSCVIDHLLDEGVGEEVGELLGRGEAAAPDVLVFEVLAVARRLVLRGEIEERRAAAAIAELGELTLDVYPTGPLRLRAWNLRENLTAADALYVALAEALEEPLVTKDSGLCRAAAISADVRTVHLPA